MLVLPDLLVPKKRYFGLSIESNALHAVELNEKGHPVHMGEIQIPSGIFTDGIITQKDVFIKILSQLYQTGKFSTPYVAVCFPEAFAYTRGYALPNIPDEDMNEAVEWHAKDLFPFPTEEIYYDWKTLKKTDKEYQTAVVAVQKNILDPMVDTLVAAGLKPLRFEPDASALVRLLQLNQGTFALLIEINQQSSYITLVEEEKALFTTVVTCSQSDTPESYLSSIDQTLKEIAQFYRQKGVLTDTTAKVLITGQMASEDWATHLTSILNYPTQILKTEMQHVGYNKAYAAAKLKIAPPIDPQSINLLPMKTQHYYDTERNMLFYKILLTRICLFIGVLTAVSCAAYISLSLEKQLLESTVKDLQGRNQSQATSSQSLLLLNAQSSNVMTLAPMKLTPVKQIRSLEKLITDDITITQWEYDDSRLQFKLTGIATSRNSLLAFKKRLDESPDFSLAVLPIMSLEASSQLPFTLTFITKN